MGCSSSKASRSGGPDTEDLVTGVPKMGIHDNGNGKDALGDKNSKVHTLLLKKNERSMQGRPNQVRRTAFMYCGFMGGGGVCGLVDEKKQKQKTEGLFSLSFCLVQRSSSIIVVVGVSSTCSTTLSILLYNNNTITEEVEF